MSRNRILVVTLAFASIGLLLGGCPSGLNVDPADSGGAAERDETPVVDLGGGTQADLAGIYVGAVTESLRDVLFATGETTWDRRQQYTLSLSFRSDGVLVTDTGVEMVPDATYVRPFGEGTLNFRVKSVQRSGNRVHVSYSCWFAAHGGRLDGEGSALYDFDGAGGLSYHEFYWYVGETKRYESEYAGGLSRS